MADAPSNSPAPAPQAPAEPSPQAAADDATAWQQARDKALDPGKAAEPAKANGKARAEPAKAEDGKPDLTKPVPTREWQHLQRKREKLAARETELATREEKARQAEAAREARSKELDTRAQVVEALENDPKALIAHIAKKLGVSEAKAVNHINSFLLEGRSPVELEVDKLKAEQKRRDEAEQTRREQAEKQSQQAKISGYLSEIAKHVTMRADDYTHLPAFPPELVAASAWERIKDHWEKTGISLPLDKVLETLESEEEKRYLIREERRKKRLGAPPPSDPREGGPPVNRDTAQRPNTLNHQLATQRSTGRAVSDDEDWTAIKRSAGISR